MDFRSLLGEPTGQGWVQLAELALAFVLSASIGLEREMRQKSAGLRTYTLVGVSSALIMLVSKYGFTDILENGRVVVDPSRVAAQIVSGIGFIGGGVIFVRKDLVRGLTTASIVWLTAAIGMAAGAGLPILAIAGSLAAKKSIPASAGTFPTSGGLFVGLVVGVILIVGGLTFFPALALGPIVEQLAINAGTLFSSN